MRVLPNKGCHYLQTHCLHHLGRKTDSVRHFFKHLGFDDAYIRKLISGYPYILCTDVEKMIQPNINALQQLGFSDNELWKFIARNPQALILHSAIHRIEFWKVFLKSDMQKLLSAFTSPKLICYNLKKRLIPRFEVVEILKSNGSVNIKPNLYSLMNYPEKTFLEKIVVPCQEMVPKLHETYVAACKGPI